MKVKLWDREKGDCLKTFSYYDCYDQYIKILGISKDNKFIITSTRTSDGDGYSSQEVKIWNVKKEEFVEEYYLDKEKKEVNINQIVIVKY